MIERIPFHDRVYLNFHNTMWVVPFPYTENLVERLFYSLAPYDASNVVISQLKEYLGKELK